MDPTNSRNTFKREGIIKSVIHRDIESIRKCLQATEMAAAMADCLGWTAIHHAAYHGDEKILTILLDHYSPDIRKQLVNIKTYLHHTPLMVACQEGAKLNNNVAQILIMNGCDVNFSFDGDSAVNMCCCRRGKPKEVLQILRTLRDMGCSFEGTRDSLPPLHNALDFDLEDSVMKFLAETVKWTRESLEAAEVQSLLGTRRINAHILLLFINLDFPGTRLDITPVTMNSVQILLRGIETSKFNHRFVLLMFLNLGTEENSSATEIMKLILQEASARGLNITIPDVFVSYYEPESPERAESPFPVTSEDSMEFSNLVPVVKKRKIMNSQILFGLFPERKATESLKAMCRAATRAWLVQQHSTAIDAYNWLNQCALPIGIKRLLLYEEECPVVRKSVRELMDSF